MPRRKASPAVQRLEWLALKLMVFFCAISGRHTSFLLGWILGTLFWWFGFKRRRRTLSNISLVYGESLTERQKRSLGRRCYAFAGGFWTELFWFGQRKQAGLPRCCYVIGAEHLRKGLTEGRGVLLVSGHIGNFPLLGIYLQRFGFPVHTMIVPPFNPHINLELEKMRRRVGLPEIYVVPRETAAIRCLKLLRENQVIWALIDQKFHKGIVIKFLGHPAQVAAGTALFAIRENSVALGAAIHRTNKGKYVITITPPIPVARNKDKPIIATMQNFSDIVGKFVLKYPEQWTWFHRRWQVRWHKVKK